MAILLQSCLPQYGFENKSSKLNISTQKSIGNSLLLSSPTSSFENEEDIFEKELEAEICQRFVRISCEKMLASRNSRGGARLHRNLLILHMLRKVRNNTKILPYECASLLKQQHFQTTSQQQKKLSSTIIENKTIDYVDADNKNNNVDDDSDLMEDVNQKIDNHIFAQEKKQQQIIKDLQKVPEITTTPTQQQALPKPLDHKNDQLLEYKVQDVKLFKNNYYTQHQQQKTAYKLSFDNKITTKKSQNFNGRLYERSASNGSGGNFSNIIHVFNNQFSVESKNSLLSFNHISTKTTTTHKLDNNEAIDDDEIEVAEDIAAEMDQQQIFETTTKKQLLIDLTTKQQFIDLTTKEQQLIETTKEQQFIETTKEQQFVEAKTKQQQFVNLTGKNFDWISNNNNNNENYVVDDLIESSKFSKEVPESNNNLILFEDEMLLNGACRKRTASSALLLIEENQFDCFNNINKENYLSTATEEKRICCNETSSMTDDNDENYSTASSLDSGVDFNEFFELNFDIENKTTTNNNNIELLYETTTDQLVPFLSYNNF